MLYHCIYLDASTKYNKLKISQRFKSGKDMFADSVIIILAYIEYK